MNKLFRRIIFAALTLSTSAVYAVPITYSYVGTTFTSNTLTGLASDTNLTGSFTVDLAPNLTSTTTNSPIIEAIFSLGSLTTTLADLSVQGAVFITDASGFITDYAIHLSKTSSTSFTTLPAITTIIAQQSDGLGVNFNVNVHRAQICTSARNARCFRFQQGDVQDFSFGPGTLTAVSTVPEPGTILLLSAGFLGLARYRWSQRRYEGTQLG